MYVRSSSCRVKSGEWGSVTAVNVIKKSAVEKKAASRDGPPATGGGHSKTHEFVRGKHQDRQQADSLSAQIVEKVDRARAHTTVTTILAGVCPAPL